MAPRGEPFTLEVRPAAGSRHRATAWDKANRLVANAVVLPLETNQVALDLADRADALDTIESRLAGDRTG